MDTASSLLGTNFHPDDAPSPVDGLLSDCLWGDRYTMFFDSSDPSQIDTGHQNEWADIEMPDGTMRGPKGSHWSQVDWIFIVCSA